MYQSRTLSIEETFDCDHPGCSRTFSTKRNLNDHLKGHLESKPHSCTFPSCGKSFLRPAHLRIHARIHTGEKPFACDYPGCAKKFNQKSALKQHSRSHTGERPYACPIQGCSKSFSTSSSCKRHSSTHHASYYETLEASKAYLSNMMWTGFELDSAPSSPLSSSSDDFCEVEAEITRTETRMKVNFLLN